MEFRPAKLDTLAKIISVTSTAFMISLCLVFLIRNLPFAWFFCLLMISIIVISYLLSPKTYYIEGGTFVIEKIIGRKIYIPLNEIEGIVEVKDFSKLKPLRSMGNGGLFGYYGLFTTTEYGNINCQLTRLKNILIIKSKKGYFAISPERPERLIEWFQSTTGISEVQSVPPQIVKKASPLILLIPDTIFTITLLMVILLYDKLPPKIATHFDLHGNPDGWSNKISFIFSGILPQVILLAISFILYFASRNKYRNPMPVYFLVIIVSLIQIFIAYTSLDIYWFNVYKSHLIPMGYAFIGFTALLLIFLYVYYKMLKDIKQ
ncbi:MAG: PH domain-containing protein [candidate division WOR-3 bacterium]